MYKTTTMEASLSPADVPISTEKYREAEQIPDPDYVILHRDYGGNLRHFFREHMGCEQAQATIDFLAKYSASALEIDGHPHERLSLGANTRGDIFCITAREATSDDVRGLWHNVFSGITQEIRLHEEPAYYDDADIAYRNRGGNPIKRQFVATLDEDRPVRFVLSGLGNRCEELDERGAVLNTPKEQLLRDCRFLEQEIVYDQLTKNTLGATALASR